MQYQEPKRSTTGSDFKEDDRDLSLQVLLLYALQYAVLFVFPPAAQESHFVDSESAPADYSDHRSIAR